MRFSPNRQAILDCLRSTKAHPTADWILEQLRPELPNLNQATVYRNLVQLKEEGLIRSMGVVAGQEHFDADLQPHAHVMCSRCGRITDIPLSREMITVQEDAFRQTGFEIFASRYMGLCPECRKKDE